MLCRTRRALARSRATPGFASVKDHARHPVARDGIQLARMGELDKMLIVPGQRIDTAIVPRNGTLTFRSRFLDFTGRYVLHCHMMNHEELGMMQIVEVSAD